MHHSSKYKKREDYNYNQIIIVKHLQEIVKSEVICYKKSNVQSKRTYLSSKKCKKSMFVMSEIEFCSLVKIGVWICIVSMHWADSLIFCLFVHASSMNYAIVKRHRTKM